MARDPSRSIVKVDLVSNERDELWCLTNVFLIGFRRGFLRNNSRSNARRVLNKEATICFDKTAQHLLNFSFIKCNLKFTEFAKIELNRPNVTKYMYFITHVLLWLPMTRPSWRCKSTDNASSVHANYNNVNKKTDDLNLASLKTVLTVFYTTKFALQ